MPVVQKMVRTFPKGGRFREEIRCRDALSWADLRWSGTEFTLIMLETSAK